MIQLIIFDVDGTLAERYTLDLLPGVREFFHLTLHGNCQPAPALAIATNQGGVGMRHWMESRGFGKPEKYPAQSSVEERLRALLAALGATDSLPVYISYSYKTKNGKYSPIPAGQAGNPSWRRDWRKPEPGMLLQAMADARVSPENTLYVGDSPDDQQAAAAAGCHFAWAKDFFSLPLNGCSDLMDIIQAYENPSQPSSR